MTCTHSGPCLLAIAPYGDNGKPGTIRHGAVAAIGEAAEIIRDGAATEATREDLTLTLAVLFRRPWGSTIMVPVTREEREAFTRVVELGREYLANVDRDDDEPAHTDLVWQCEAR